MPRGRGPNPFHSLATAGVYSRALCCARPAAVTITSGDEGRQLLCGEGRWGGGAMCHPIAFRYCVCLEGGGLLVVVKVKSERDVADTAGGQGRTQ